MNLGVGGIGRQVMEDTKKSLEMYLMVILFFFLERAEEAGERTDMSLRNTVLPVTSLPAPSLQPGRG